MYWLLHNRCRLSAAKSQVSLAFEFLFPTPEKILWLTTTCSVTITGLSAVNLPYSVPHTRSNLEMLIATRDIVRAYPADHLSRRDFKAELANFAVRDSEFLRGIGESIDDYEEGSISEDQLKQHIKDLL